MTDLQEKQFALGRVDGSEVVFGLDAPVHLLDDGWAPTSAELRSSATNRAYGNGKRFGRDFRGSATWGFKGFTNAEDEETAWEYLADLQAAWEDDALEEQPDAVVPLRYRVANRTLRVYGRPRRWTATPTNESLNGVIRVVSDFEVSDPLVFEDQLQSQTIGLSVPFDPSAGVQIPARVPFRTRSRRVSRDSTITVGGKVPTPCWLTFTGSMSGAKVVGPGWTVELLDAVHSGDPVTVDGRSWVRSAVRQSGGGVRVDPRVTRISKILLPPGTHDIVFTAEDVTGASTVTVSWHNAQKSPR